MCTLVRHFITAWKSPRWRWAMLIAVVSDALGFAVLLLPPALWLLDAATAIALIFVLGFNWKLFAALAVEVIPFAQLFPAWTLVVMAMAATEAQTPLDAAKGSSA